MEQCFVLVMSLYGWSPLKCVVYGLVKHSKQTHSHSKKELLCSLFVHAMLPNLGSWVTSWGCWMCRCWETTLQDCVQKLCCKSDATVAMWARWATHSMQCMWCSLQEGSASHWWCCYKWQQLTSQGDRERERNKCSVVSVGIQVYL